MRITPIILTCALLAATVAFASTGPDVEPMQGDTLFEFSDGEMTVYVFPQPMQGPDGAALHFVVVGLDEVPLIGLPADAEMITVRPTVLSFEPGGKLYGSVPLPDPQAGGMPDFIWINNTYIPLTEDL